MRAGCSASPITSSPVRSARPRGAPRGPCLGIDVPAFEPDDLARIVELAGLDGLRASVAAELEALPASQREAVRLRVVEELPYPEIADRLAVTEPTARARVSRGLRVLRAALEPPSRPSLPRSPHHDHSASYRRARRAGPALRRRPRHAEEPPLGGTAANGRDHPRQRRPSRRSKRPRHHGAAVARPRPRRPFQAHRRQLGNSHRPSRPSDRLQGRDGASGGNDRPVGAQRGRRHGSNRHAHRAARARPEGQRNRPLAPQPRVRPLGTTTAWIVGVRSFPPKAERSSHGHGPQTRALRAARRAVSLVMRARGGRCCRRGRSTRSSSTGRRTAGAGETGGAWVSFRDQMQ
ncbi:MAG: RNA polymerase sigma factor [Solirubrobacterales bacterium]|nr:RNA polymerase sigma factor [Solirubrobacterales bacterium]